MGGLRRQKRGNVTLVVLMFGTLLGFTALSVDVGLIRVVATEMQATLDAAALSGAGELDGTLEGIARARTTAIDIAARNRVLQRTVTLEADNVEIGTYDPASASFVLFAPGQDPLLVNAVRIVHVDPPLSPVLGGVAFGANPYPVGGSTLSVRPRAAGPAGSSDCFVPLAVPDCHLAGVPAGQNPPPFVFTFNPSPTDSIAWGNPDANPNSNFLKGQIENPCTGPQIAVGDLMQVNEGVHNSANKAIADVLNGASANPTFWDTALYGPQPLRQGDSSVTPANYSHTFEGPVALVNGGANCAAVSFSGALPVTGIGWAVIYDIVDKGGNKRIHMQLDLVNPHEVFGSVDEDATGKNVLATGAPALESL